MKNMEMLSAAGQSQYTINVIMFSLISTINQNEPPFQGVHFFISCACCLSVLASC